ncbi:hypothetical protein FSP39_016235 [Pinctada imbricata]|uniref:Beta-1,4-glucuronyltransferase 1 n=1 Tax=Pinctada imbricata TaxID=66713 RepID=A0AA89BZA4_PINIB|nr:hypothetical protein FSP39_016235 [Pinctada imbricata]
MLALPLNYFNGIVNKMRKARLNILISLSITIGFSLFIDVFIQLRCNQSQYLETLVSIEENDAIQGLGKVHIGKQIDTRDRFWIYYDVLQSDFIKNGNDKRNDHFVTIVTQTTENHLHALVELCETWKGPVSVAVFVYGVDVYSALWKLAYYHLRVPKIKAKTTFHLVIIKHLTIDIALNLRKDVTVQSSSFINSNIEGFHYPYNLLRNVALHRVRNGFVFMIDIDMLPSNGLHETFLDYINHSSNITKYDRAHIVPAFEVRNESYIPKNKTQLLSYLQENNAQSYAKMSCKTCQADTDFGLWTKIAPEKMRGFTISRQSSSYEPFYILHKSVYPKFDERFVGRGKNRISQVSKTTFQHDLNKKWCVV